MGSDKNDFVSLNKTDFNRKHVNHGENRQWARALSTDLKNCHFTLGNNKDAWRSLNQESYGDKEIPYYNKQELEQKTKDLRKSNLIMGDDNLTYQTETKDLYINGQKKLNVKTAGIAFTNPDDARKSNLDIMKGQGH